MNQTREDMEINRRLSKRLGTWTWADHTLPARVSQRREYAHAVTARRVAFVSKQFTGLPRFVSIHCAGWEN